MTQKFVMYSLLYRLEQEFNREGLKLSRQTMANWILNASDTRLRPIYDVLRRELCRELGVAVLLSPATAEIQFLLRKPNSSYAYSGGDENDKIMSQNAEK